MPRLWLLLISGLFLAAALYQLDLPGLHYDEAFEAVPTVQLLTGQPVTPFRNSALSLLGRRFPLTTQDYIGALNTYALLPFLAIGINVISLRVYSVLIGLGTLWLVYGFTHSLTGHRWAGLVAAALLTVDPTFVFWSRQGIFVTSITAMIGVAAAWCWLRWWRHSDIRFAYLGAFLFGLGLYAKLLFIWLIGALFGAFVLKLLLLSRQKRLEQTRFLLRVPQIGGLILSGLAGCWPLILYNLQTGGTFQSISENAGTSYYGVNNADVLTNLGTRLSQLLTLLNGGHLWYLGGIFHNQTTPLVFLLLCLSSLWLAYRTGRLSGLLPFLIIALTIAASIVTVSALWVTHYALIMVWPAIAIATGGWALFDYLRGKKGVRLVLSLIAGFLFITAAMTTMRYHQTLTISGGLGTHSDAIYDLTDWLKMHTDKPIIAMDWGLAAPVTVLSGGQVNPIEVFGYAWRGSDSFEAIIQPYLRPEDAIFLWRAPDEIIFDRSSDFRADYQPLQLEETILEAFYERSGRPVLGATTLVPTGTAGNKPTAP